MQYMNTTMRVNGRQGTLFQVKLARLGVNDAAKITHWKECMPETASSADFTYASNS